MTKVEAIKKILEDNNGIATWDIIYNQVEKYYPNAKQSLKWKEGLRGVFYREESKNRHFKRVGLGLLALQSFQEDKIEDIYPDNVRMHSYMEGICLEIGNFLQLQTFTADPSAKYNNLPLSQLATMKKIPEFSYPEIINSAKYIDVLWFNSKGFQFPKRAIEIVDSIGTLEPALKRCFQLIEFNLLFYILCKPEHVKKVEKELHKEPYIRIKNRFIVRDYESIIHIYRNPLQNSFDNFFITDKITI